MKKTKERILDTSLALFNSDGLSRVTLRTIANKMGISQGNLSYHYKKRDEIIEALYFQLVRNIDENIDNQKEQESPFHILVNVSETILFNFFEYRFFLLDFVQIMREHEVIRKHYLQLSIQREQQFESLFGLLVSSGMMREEILPNEYAYLYKRFQILGDFWISNAEVMLPKITKKTVLQYSEILSQAVFPYLTEKGRDVYFSLVKS